MNNYERFFASAKEKGITESELYIGKDTSLSMGVFQGEMESMEASTDVTVIARGIYNGKFGQASTSVFTKEKIPYLVESIIANAKVIEKSEVASLFKGSEKYKKVNTFNKELATIPTEKKKADLFALEKEILALDKRVVQAANISYQESDSELIILNSHGLKLKQKNNSFVFVGVAVVKDGEEIKTNFDFTQDSDYHKFDVEELAKRIVDGAIEKLGGVPIDSQKMKVVLSPGVVASLTNIYVGSADAESIQKHSSLFEGKLNEKVASSKVTITEKPLAKTLYARSFDDEGVATYNKDIIKKGVLTTYLYNLETAQKDKTTTTGNGYKAGGKIGSGVTALFIKPGNKNQEELFEMVGEGIYITELEGLHAGINSVSGNFSLKAAGFLIKNGKKDHPVALITVSGNLLKLFQDVVAIGSDAKMQLGGVFAPSFVIRKLSISGK